MEKPNDSSLAVEDWFEVPFDDVVLAFLRGEAHRFEKLTDDACRLIRTYDPQSKRDKLGRCILLSTRRGGLFDGIPPDTRWYRVEYLRNDHLDELLVMREPNWIDETDRNALGDVAIRKMIPRRPAPTDRGDTHSILEYYSDDPEQWQSPILWGHSNAGPFTILEGTHRFAWYYREAKAYPDFKNVAYVGLSDRLSHWHLPDAFDSGYRLNPLTAHIRFLQKQLRQA